MVTSVFRSTGGALLQEAVKAKEVEDEADASSTEDDDATMCRRGSFTEPVMAFL